MELFSYGKVDENGRLLIVNRAGFVDNLSTLKNKLVEIIVREKDYLFSDSYRNYYYGVIVEEVRKAYFSVGIRKTKSEVDKELRLLFLHKEELDSETGEFIITPHTLRRNDTDVTTSMMIEFCEACIIYAMDVFEWEIPYPNEVLKKLENE